MNFNVEMNYYPLRILGLFCLRRPILQKYLDTNLKAEYFRSFSMKLTIGRCNFFHYKWRCPTNSVGTNIKCAATCVCYQETVLRRILKWMSFRAKIHGIERNALKEHRLQGHSIHKRVDSLHPQSQSVFSLSLRWYLVSNHHIQRSSAFWFVARLPIRLDVIRQTGY